MFMHIAHTDLGTSDPYLSWQEWCNMRNETAMGTEKCVMITFAYSITNTAFITGIKNSYTIVLLNLPWYEIIFSSLTT